jgi:6-phosphofructokinase 1
MVQSIHECERYRLTIRQHRDWGKRKTIAIIAEGAKDKNGKKISSQEVVDLLKDKNGLNLDTRLTVLGHPQRGGPAVAQDRILATLQGVEAVKTLLEATPESETCFIAITENKICRKPLMAAVEATQEVAKAIDEQNFARAMALRDHEFAEMYNCYHITTTVGLDESAQLPVNKVGFLPKKKIEIASLTYCSA